VIQLGAEVAAAQRERRPIVALETTLVAHGFPGGEGLAVALESEQRVRDAGAVPATIGVIDGDIRVGLTEGELGLFAAAGPAAQKVGPRELAAVVARRQLGATTVGGTLTVCYRVGIRFMGTGGIGGVHRGYAERPDVSADLAALARTPTLVVSSGVKSLLDVDATLEALETLGVPVAGWRTETLPLFYSAAGGPLLGLRLDDVAGAAELVRLHWELGLHGVLLAQAPPESFDAEPLIEEALTAARGAGVTGQEVTPFVLAQLHERSDGATVRVNRRLIAENAALAAEVAVAYFG
jgi:pseudouridine-5'-phosphate glycosidase